MYVTVLAVLPAPYELQSMDTSRPINELEVFHTTPRRRKKPTVPLTDVIIRSQSQSSPVSVDLFDALFKGPFTATGTYSFNPNCKIKPKIPAPCSIQSTNVCRFSLEEDATIARQTTVKIYYEGELAWYEIISPHPSYAPIYANMLLKAEIWLWIQYRRATILTNNKSKLTGPSLKQVLRELPFRFKSRIADPIDAFHHYFIECIIQSNYFEKTMIAGPEGLDPRWMESQFASDLQYKYPAVWRSVYDRAQAAQDPARPLSSHQPGELPPVPIHNNAKKQTKETRRLRDLFLQNSEEIHNCADLRITAIIIEQNLHPSDPWHNLTAADILEKIEQHSESLLSDSIFLEAFEIWSGIDEMKAFTTDKKWWKRRRIADKYSMERSRISNESSVEASEATRSMSMESPSIDLTQDDLVLETLAPEHPTIAKKGINSLRLKVSPTGTPGTAIQWGEEQSERSDETMKSDIGLADDEIQSANSRSDILGLQKGTVSRVKQVKKITRKRKLEELVKQESPSMAQPNTLESIRWGSGRPPLKTIPFCSNEKSAVFRCPFPNCTYSRIGSSSPAAKADIDKHHHSHRNEIRDALDMLKDPFIIGGRVGGEKGNRLVRPIGAIDHLIERIEEMAKGLGSTPSKQMVV